MDCEQFKLLIGLGYSAFEKSSAVIVLIPLHIRREATANFSLCSILNNEITF